MVVVGIFWWLSVVVGGGFIALGRKWWLVYFRGLLFVAGLFWVVVGNFRMSGVGWVVVVYFGWWWVFVGLFWVVVGGSGYFLGGSGWWWMVVGRGW